MMIACAHLHRKKNGKDPHGNQRYKCLSCGKRFVEKQPNPLGRMQIDIADAKLALRLLVEGMSVRATSRTTGLHKKTVLKLLLTFGQACQRFLDERMQNLTLTHLQFDEQWTYVFKKQSRLTTTEREETSEQGDMYLCTYV